MGKLKYLVIGMMGLFSFSLCASPNLRWVEKNGDNFIVVKSFGDYVSIQMFDAGIKEKWVLKLKEKTTLQPLRMGNDLIILTVDGTVYGINRDTGNLTKSSLELNQEYISFAVVSPENNIAATLISIKPKDGKNVSVNYFALFKKENRWTCRDKKEIEGIRYPVVIGKSIYLLAVEGKASLYKESLDSFLVKQ